MKQELVTLSSLANVALVDVALDMGFNCVGVERHYAIEDDQTTVAFTFGNAEEMRQPRLMTPPEWALAYQEDSLCSRDKRTIQVPETVAVGPKKALRDRLVSGLLELAA